MFDPTRTGQGVDQGMDGPSVLEVPAQGHVQAAQPALFLPEGVEVEQGLGGVLVSAVPGVHDRDVAVGGHEARGTLPGVADDQEVGELAHHARGIGQTLALRDGGGLDVGRADDPSPQAKHRCLEGESRPCAGFEKEVGQDGAPEAVGLLAEIGFYFGRRIEDGFDLSVGEIIDGDEVPPAQAHGSLSAPCGLKIFPAF